MTDPADLLRAVPNAKSREVGRPRPLTETLYEQVIDLSELFEACRRDLRTARDEVMAFAEYSANSGLPVDEPSIAHLLATTEQAWMRITGQQRTLVGRST